MNTQHDDHSLSISDVYAEIGVNYRYFLTWRHRLFAGYFALLAALAIALSWLVTENQEMFWVPFPEAAWINKPQEKAASKMYECVSLSLTSSG